MSGGRKDYRDRLADVANGLDATAPTVRQADEKATQALSAAMASRLDLGSFDIKFKTVVSVSLGVRTVSVAVPDAKVGDRINPHANASWAAGYAVLGNGYVPSAGVVELRILTPAVSVIVDVTLPVRLIGFRATA